MCIFPWLACAQSRTKISPYRSTLSNRFSRITNPISESRLIGPSAKSAESVAFFSNRNRLWGLSRQFRHRNPIDYLSNLLLLHFVSFPSICVPQKPDLRIPVRDKTDPATKSVQMRHLCNVFITNDKQKSLFQIDGSIIVGDRSNKPNGNSCF